MSKKGSMMWRLFSLVLIGMTLGMGQAFAGGKLQPFILASSGAGDVAGKVSETKGKLTSAGFEVVGEYSPYSGVTVIAVTNDALKSNAAKSEKGGFGAVTRVAVTQVGGDVQVSYSNPVYMAHSYRMKGDLSDVASTLESALGASKSFGSPDKGGITGDDLEDWHYMFGMPYFDDPEEVGSAGSHSAAVAKVLAGLKAGKGGTSLVFQVAIPGKEEVLFGVGLSSGDGADKAVMDAIDKGAEKGSAHLPYGLLVSGEDIFMLPGKYRIASSFPDLPMGDFMSISSAPGAIEDAMEAVAD